MIVRRRFLTILELLISMSLTVMILGVLTYFYHQMTVAGTVLDRQKEKIFAQKYVEHRLGTVLARATHPNAHDKYAHFFTSTQDLGFAMPGSQSLVFVYNNSVQSNKNMACQVIGRIVLDQKGRLLLVTWPSEKRWVENEPIPYSHEVLMDGVKELRFSFFVPPIKGKTDLKTGAPRNESGADPLGGESERWTSEWKAEWRRLPAMGKLHLVTAEGSIEYAFACPHVDQPITYDH